MTRNESPSSAIPIPRGDDADLERGSAVEEEEDLAATLVNTPRRGWRELAGRGLAAIRTGEGSWRMSGEADRSR